MTREPNLREIERRAYTSYHQDGLLDIFVGVYILGFGLGIWVDRIWEPGFGSIMPAILVATILPIWVHAKRKLTMPRIGFVKFGPRGPSRLVGVLVGLSIMGLAFFMLFSWRPLWIKTIMQHGMIFIGLVSMVICSMFGYSMGLRRLYVYGLLTLILFVSGHFIGVFFGYILLILGTTVMTAGLALLKSFVGKYPLHGDEAVAE